jgi:hypothetical protein
LFGPNNPKVYTTNRNRHAQNQMNGFFVQPVMNPEPSIEFKEPGEEVETMAVGQLR